MNPPPPRLPASGKVAARAKAVATAASIAFPPSRSASRPASAAFPSCATTTCFENAPPGSPTATDSKPMSQATAARADTAAMRASTISCSPKSNPARLEPGRTTARNFVP